MATGYTASIAGGISFNSERVKMIQHHGPGYKPDKIIRIKQCAGGICPYLIKEAGFFSCGKDKGYKRTDKEIPEWCPLEDYET